ncbi:MAG TPA: hypothetical protein VEF03_01295 [Candidatus Binataceae bacterium]|nr:hypothetical protein [Candidatus Binataceae bacterium]
MRKLLLFAMAMSISAPALAGARIDVQSTDAAKESARQESHQRSLNEHPKTQPVPNDDLRVVITKDAIARSCCRPPDLVVAGKVTNITAHPINYVKFIFSFEDENGKVVYAEDVYNRRAESMADDSEVQRILKEKPHFAPLGPGESDTFAFSIPTPLLPPFAKVELFANDVKAEQVSSRSPN